MNCVNCGVEIAPGASFCQNCGRAVSDTASATRVSPAEVPSEVAGSSAAKEAASEPTGSVPMESPRGKRLLVKVARVLVTVLLTIVIGKVLEYLSADVRRFLEKADDFVWTGVKEGQPFHFCAVFYREWVHGGSPPVAFVRAIGDIIMEGAAAVLTMALVLFIGISITYDRKNLLNTLYTTLFLGPIIGGCLLYVVMAAMAELSIIFGVGAKVCTYIGTMVPLVKEGVGVAIESKKEKVAEKLVDRISGEVRKKV